MNYSQPGDVGFSFFHLVCPRVSASFSISQLLTVCPTSNCLALVYRDRETLRFVKHINATCKDSPHIDENNSENFSGFVDLSMVYYE